jgi:alpha-D-xyloside xylohydrolase
VPTGPAIQFTGNNSHSPVTLNVYTGADGVFSLYEDDGTSRQYLNGQFVRIPIAYDEQTRTLTIGARQGGFPGMAGRRTIRVRWVQPNRARPLAFDTADATFTYDGTPKRLRPPR